MGNETTISGLLDAAARDRATAEAERRDLLSRRAVLFIGDGELRELLDLPAGLEVTGVWAASERRAIGVSVVGPTLTPTADAEMSPTLGTGHFSRKQRFIDGELWTRFEWVAQQT